MVLKSVNFLHKSHIKNYFIERSKKVLESVLIGLTTTFNFLHILSLKLFIHFFFPNTCTWKNSIQTTNGDRETTSFDKSASSFSKIMTERRLKSCFFKIKFTKAREFISEKREVWC